MGRNTARREIKIHGIKARIINGQSYFAKSELDKIMDPSRNAPGVKTQFFGNPT